jgi:DNA-binding transcriptional LysR family regulator
VGTRIPPPPLARHFLAVAKAGTIDRDTGDYVPPLKVDSVWMAREVVLASDAVTGGPVMLFDDDVAAGRLARLPISEQWGSTGYGFVARSDAVLSPAAERFKDEVRAIEAEVAAAGKAWLRSEGRAAPKKDGSRRRQAAIG